MGGETLGGYVLMEQWRASVMSSALEHAVLIYIVRRNQYEWMNAMCNVCH